ncbi:Calcium-transporting ATPase 1 [Neolecta irregularis DAH-3]|uniref:Calcium-transporting ATPase n=1 Tax=Neolecta irregularis (strain DAH-3) TaxID=1198029 RepID=A0A1U7LPT6_NEOID|nr:Calcium-transporting ATPase 1 [Neolecta irregularis DAH-3]|eukprot:OLL24667.1 Calcium-transporting ATPase 1 [Neolecta irregularis DAH-3]
MTGSPPARLLPVPVANASARFCELSVADALAQLFADPHGLSPREAAHRRAVHGANELDAPEHEGLLLRFVKQFYESSLILLLLGSAAVSLLMGNTDDALSISLAILIVTTVGFVQEYRSEKSLEELNKLVPHYCSVLRGDHSIRLLANEIVPGDIIKIHVGDRIPADLRLLEAVHLQIDESNMTGENEPTEKHVNAIQSNGEILPVTDRRNIAFMGTLVRHGHGKGLVVGTGMDTELGGVEKPKTPLQQSMDALGKQLSFLSFCVIGVIVFIGLVQGRPWLDMFTIGVSLAVAAIPEGLPIIVTVTLALGVFRMAGRKAIVRRLPSVETLGSVSVVCSDKTGTLTMNHMTITHTYTCGDDEPIDCTVESAHYLLNHNVALKKALWIGNICNNSRINEYGKIVGQPTDVAFMEILSSFGLTDNRDTFQRTKEIPFSSERKWQAVTGNTYGSTEQFCIVKGAHDCVLQNCTNQLYRDGKTEPLDPKKINIAASKMAQQGLRVIALALGRSSSPQDLTFCGLVGMYDPPRPHVAESISKLLHGGVKVIMITGDSEQTAVSIAQSLGIPQFHSVCSGEQLDNLSERQLQELISRVTIFARTTPRHKMKIVKALQASGEVVAMTGDGVNDAPALKLADIGISMGKLGTDVAKEAADMILTDDDFTTILGAIEEGKAIFYNIRNFVTFQLSTSMAALSLIAISTLFGLPNPLNAMQILWINILMDGPPAQSLGVESVDPEVMSQPPRSRDALILTRKVLFRVCTQACVILLGTLIVYMYNLVDGQVTSRDTTMVRLFTPDISRAKTDLCP